MSESLAANRVDAVRNRGAILDAAVEVLADTPTASLAEIAKRAGLGRATLYRHFENREALGAAIRSEALDRAASALEAAAVEEGPAREAVHRVVLALLPLGMRFRVILYGGVDGDAEFVAAREQVLQPLMGLIARAIGNDELDAQVDPVWIAAALPALLVAAVRVASSGSLDVERTADLLCRTLFDGLGSAKRAAPDLQADS
ncbi:TetR/AcrR family transcriptional regulator [Aeromicrobium sp. A1-2]|uniref:TetR/AcrR family transcriptional regulator n=1 Tax=Aeromicrobium sp. A1-2 TaxID=2107713 RepID=UPI0013C33AB3|nr:TetR/AcrR family transcriptional regulator [Aeromicrobium sp. A1-2]